MWNDNALTRRLPLRHPIIQGPFGGGLSSIALLVAVSEAGGLGSFGIHHLAPDAILELARDIRARTGKPYGLNLWVSDRDPGGELLSPEQFAQGVQRYRPYYDELGAAPPSQPPPQVGQDFGAQMEAVLEARPPVFSFVFGIPPREALAECRRRGIVTIGTATTVDEAVAVQDAGADMVIATGFEAGGHRVSFLAAPERSLMGTFAVVPQVADAVSIPVIAAGGIGDARGVAAAMLLGAQGVQVGTAFLACEESGTHPLHRAALFSPQARDTTLTRVFTGRLARGIRNGIVERMESEHTALSPYPIQRWWTNSFRAAAVAQGRTDLVALWAGQAAPLSRHRDARSLYEDLVAGTDALLGQR